MEGEESQEFFRLSDSTFLFHGVEERRSSSYETISLAPNLVLGGEGGPVSRRWEPQGRRPLTHPQPPPLSPWPPGPPGGFRFNQTPLEPRSPASGPSGPRAAPGVGSCGAQLPAPSGAQGPLPGEPLPAPVPSSQPRPMEVSVSRAHPLSRGTRPGWPSEEDQVRARRGGGSRTAARGCLLCAFPPPWGLGPSLCQLAGFCH